MEIPAMVGGRMEQPRVQAVCVDVRWSDQWTWYRGTSEGGMSHREPMRVTSIS